MSTRRQHNQKDAIYFITFTCHAWLNLFEITKCYNSFDKWFDYLSSKYVSILGYVIMPNHFHVLLHIPERCDKTLNQLVSNGKRFLAYEIVKLLDEFNKFDTVKRLQQSVPEMEKMKGKKHQVFRPSFDAKECFNREMIEIKLDYIHFNPVRGKWRLVGDYSDYPYSSAGYYEKAIPHKYVKHYRGFI